MLGRLVRVEQLHQVVHPGQLDTGPTLIKAVSRQHGGPGDGDQVGQHASDRGSLGRSSVPGLPRHVHAADQLSDGDRMVRGRDRLKQRRGDHICSGHRSLGGTAQRNSWSAGQVGQVVDVEGLGEMDQHRKSGLHDPSGLQVLDPVR